MSNPNVTIDRDKFIGGSDLPTILGLNAKYGTSIFDFTREKIGLIPKTFKGNQFTRYGQLMEPVIRDYINSIFGANYLEDTIVDTDRGYRGNTDGIDREAEYPILEIKTFGEELDVDYYEAQCQFYMETFNVDACILVGYKRPKDFYTGIDYDLENDDSYFNVDFDPNNITIVKIMRNKFIWARIEERIVAFKKALDYLREKRDDATEDEFNNIFYGTDLVAMTNKIAVLENQLNSFKDIEKEHKKLKEELYKVFEDKGIISFDTGAMKITKVNPTSYTTEIVDAEKLKAENLEIFNKYKLTKTTNKKGYILITNKKEG